MNKSKIALTLLIGFVLAGCSASYTSIQPAGENAYYVTRTKNNFFKISGTLYHCTGQGKKMVCTEISSE
jgi:hypothetical protein